MGSRHKAANHVRGPVAYKIQPLIPRIGEEKLDGLL